MSRLFQESFERGDLLQFSSIGASVSINTSVPITGARYLRCLAANAVKRNLAAAGTEYYIGFFFRSGTSTNAPILRLVESGSSTTICCLSVNVLTDGLLKAYRGEQTTLIGTDTHPLSVGTLYHIQVHIIISASVGVFEIKVDDNLGLSLTGGNTGTLSATQVDFAGTIGSGEWFIDDLIINDASGSIDNTWPGIRRFTLMLPAGVGTYVNNWSRNTGSTNWQAVDEVPNNSDTDYLFTTTPSLYESFSMADHGLANADIRALITTAVAKKDSGVSKLIVGIRDDDNNTDYMTPAVDLGTSYGIVQERRTVDPSSGTAFTLAGANATQALIVSSA